ncbi:MAG: ATP-binding cassette domain-containing protein, partial [Paracoccaceae bacterium]
EQYRDLSSQSMVFQRPVLLRRTALENIMFPLHARGMSKANALVQAKTWMVRAELEKRFHSPARRLSGGEQQRLALARALALSPKVLLLDEPCAHLDPNAAVKVEALIQTAIKEGVKVIMVTHNAAQAERLGEELILMRDGKIIAHHPKETFSTQTSNEDLTRFLAGHPLKGVL